MVTFCISLACVFVVPSLVQHSKKCPLQEFVPGRIPVRTFEGQKFLTGISACRCCFCCSMHTSLGKCGMATTGKLLDHCTQLSNCKNPLVHQCQYTRGGHVPVIRSITSTPVVAMSHIHCPMPIRPWWPRHTPAVAHSQLGPKATTTCHCQ